MSIFLEMKAGSYMCAYTAKNMGCEENECRELYWDCV